MRIGIVSPSKLKNEKLVSKVAEMLKDYEVVLTPDKGSVSEYFAQEYLKLGGKKVIEIVPLDDKEFGYSWINLDFGENINCSTWRNQPEKLNEECDVLVCLGYSTGGLIEICYSKWFNKKSVYILKEFIDVGLPKELEASLDLNYIGIDELQGILKNEK